MKLVKLLTHPKDYRDADLVLNPKEYPDLRPGDVVEIYHPEHEYSRLLLQVKCVNDDFQQKGLCCFSVS
ncbi:hypothetical protein LSAT2_027048 [Lamellibrachia satsuma]|nr:hypothetical protein LSAT2_027048 [Lamellibrachia satsuma]